MKPIIEGGMNTLNASPDAILEAKERIVSFRNKHHEGFLKWWQSNSIMQREKFIREVYHTIVQSLNDRYCYSVKTGRKIYENRYDHYLSLWPGFTVEHLVHDSNFPDLIDAWCQFNYLAKQLNEMVVKFRLLYRSNVYPRQRPEWINEAVVKKGDDMVEIASRLLMTGEQSGGETDSLGEMITVDDPKTLRDGTGENGINLYDLGAFIHMFEFSTVCEVLSVQAHVVASLIDEYLEEVIGGEVKRKTMKALLNCKSCGVGSSSTVKILICNRCEITGYCSVACQRSHWSIHKTFCRQFPVPN